MSPKKSARCPNCGGALEIYEGENRHKIGTGYCPKDGQRYKLEEAVSGDSR